MVAVEPDVVEDGRYLIRLFLLIPADSTRYRRFIRRTSEHAATNFRDDALPRQTCRVHASCHYRCHHHTPTLTMR